MTPDRHPSGLEPEESTMSVLSARVSVFDRRCDPMDTSSPEWRARSPWPATVWGQLRRDRPVV